MKPDLSQLHDIHLPPPVSWWPPAIGWWLLLLLFVVIALVAYWLQRRRRRQQWRRDALAQLQQLQQQSLTPQALAIQLSMLLRRVAITRFPREEVASLTGDNWLAFLDRQMKVPEFTQRGRALVTAPYSNSVEADTAQLCTLAEKWINGVAR